MKSEISIACEAIRKGSAGNGLWEQGLGELWDYIDAGSQEARVALASLFDEYGLHQFSQDHWRYLYETGAPQFKAKAITGIASNLSWIGDYSGALAIAAEVELSSELKTRIHGAKDKAASSGWNPENLALLLDLENQLLSSLNLQMNLDTQLQLVECRIRVANVMTHLKHNAGASQRIEAINIPIAGSMVVSRPLDALLDDIEPFWSNLAHATGIAIAMAAEAERSDFLSELAEFGNEAVAKLHLLRGEIEVRSELEKEFLQNIAYALGVKNSFAGFILNGLV